MANFCFTANTSTYAHRAKRVFYLPLGIEQKTRNGLLLYALCHTSGQSILKIMDLCYSVKRVNYAHERKTPVSNLKKDARMTKPNMYKRKTNLACVTRNRKKER
jgi:hypothetical protein